MNKIAAQVGYDESKIHLTSRIEAHRRASKGDVEAFILKHASPQAGEVVVDLCCGTGKQVLSMAPFVGTTGKLIGLDLQEELLEAGRRAAKQLPQVSFVRHDANRALPFSDSSVDLLTCCYGIYYMENLKAVVQQVVRVLKPFGRAFVLGPARDNNEEIRRLHSELTGTAEPAAITEYRTRVEAEVLPLLQRHMPVRSFEFRNQLGFDSVEDFEHYYRATPLLSKSSPDPEQREAWVRRAAERVRRHLEDHGAFTIRKVALALLGQRTA